MSFSFSFHSSTPSNLSSITFIVIYQGVMESEGINSDYLGTRTSLKKTWVRYLVLSRPGNTVRTRDSPTEPRSPSVDSRRRKLPD